MSTKILIFIDGTANDADASKHINEDVNISNVLKLHFLCGGNVNNQNNNDLQKSYYYSGVGTKGLAIKRLKQKAIANKDPHTMRENIYSDICNYYKEGDEIFIFGFSRGAAIARQLLVLLEKKGLKSEIKPKIRFLGLWDTVVSIGVPNLDPEKLPDSEDLFEEDNNISCIVEEAFHLVAIDETRLAYRPVLISSVENVKEIWFLGVHSDVGGGYRKSALSDITLDFMIQKIKSCGVILASRNEILENNNIKFEDIKLQPDPLGEIHHHERDSLSAKKTLRLRDIVVLENGKVSTIPPTVHYSVAERIKNDEKYRPDNLKKHYILEKSGEVKLYTDWKDHLNGNITT